MTLASPAAVCLLQHWVLNVDDCADNSSSNSGGWPVLQAALVKFSSFDIKEGSKMNTYSQFETVDTAAGQFQQMPFPCHDAISAISALGDGSDITSYGDECCVQAKCQWYNEGTNCS